MKPDVGFANPMGYDNSSSTNGGVPVFRVVGKVNIGEVFDAVLEDLVDRDIKYLNMLVGEDFFDSRCLLRRVDIEGQ